MVVFPWKENKMDTCQITISRILIPRLSSFEIVGRVSLVLRERMEEWGLSFITEVCKTQWGIVTQLQKETKRSFCGLTEGRGGKMTDLSEMITTDKGMGTTWIFCIPLNIFPSEWGMIISRSNNIILRKKTQKTLPNNPESPELFASLDLSCRTDLWTPSDHKVVAVKNAALVILSAVNLRMYRSRVTKPQFWKAVMPKK